jgi:outer membrane protein assembly factor BamB
VIARRLGLGALAAGALLVGGCGGADRETPTTAPASAVAIGQAGAVAPGDWPTFGFSQQRSGVGPTQTGISAANLGQLTLRRVRIDGIADSAAIELGGVTVRRHKYDVVVVTTSYGKTIAIDAGSGTRLWEFVPRGVNSTPGSPQVTTASPVADPDRRYVYAASPNGFIHKLAVADGHQAWARRITLDPRHEKIAAALNVSGRSVIAATGGYIGDIPPYDGHVVTIERRSGRIAHVWNTQCSSRHRLIAPSSCGTTQARGDSAIWARAGAVIQPGDQRILISTGNGPFDGRFNWGNSVLVLSSDASRALRHWTPADYARLSAGDVDVGSTAPALLPRYHDRRLAVQGGKDGKLRLLDLDRLNGTSGAAGRRLGGELQVVSAPGGGQVLTAPAVWPTGGRPLLYVANDSGTSAYQLVGGGRPRLRPLWQNGSAGTSPVLAGGLLYVYDEVDGALNVREPTSGALLRSLPVAPGHWNSPLVARGRIIEPTGSYHDGSATSTIAIYHLPGR